MKPNTRKAIRRPVTFGEAYEEKTQNKWPKCPTHGCELEPYYSAGKPHHCPECEKERWQNMKPNIKIKEEILNDFAEEYTGDKGRKWSELWTDFLELSVRTNDIDTLVRKAISKATLAERARMRRAVEDFKNTLELIKTKNPYPEDVFPEVEITAENFEKRRDAMFGTLARNVWRICVERVEEELDAHLYQVDEADIDLSNATPEQLKHLSECATKEIMERVNLKEGDK